MATTDQINDLIANYTDLKAFYEGERQALQNARDDLPNHLFITRHVDEINGLTGGDGSLEAPFDSFDKVFDNLQDGQHLRILLLSDAIWRNRQTVVQSNITLTGVAADGVTFQRRALQLSGSADNDPAKAAGGRFEFAVMRFANIDLAINPVSPHFVADGFLSVSFRDCDIDGTQADAGGQGLFWSWNGPLSVHATGTTYSGMGGQWLKDAAAGTSLDVTTTGSLFDDEISNA